MYSCAFIHTQYLGKDLKNKTDSAKATFPCELKGMSIGVKGRHYNSVKPLLVMPSVAPACTSALGGQTEEFKVILTT